MKKQRPEATNVIEEVPCSPEELARRKHHAKIVRIEYIAENFVRAALTNPNVHMLLHGSPFHTRREVEDKLTPGAFLANRAYDLAEQFWNALQERVAKDLAAFEYEETEGETE